MNEMRARRKRSSLLIILFVPIFAAFIVLVLKEKFVFGSEAGESFYPYIGAASRSPLLVFLEIMPLLLLLVYLTRKIVKRHALAAITIWLVVGLAAQLYIHTLYPSSLGDIIRSDVSNGFYSPTLKYDALEFIRNYNSIRGDLHVHAQANMPGKILFFYFLGIFVSTPLIMGCLIILFSNIGAVITYAICLKLFKNKLIALYSLILYLFIPAKLCFFPILNTLTPVFILLALLLFLCYLESRKVIYLIVLGLSLYLVLLFEPLPLVVGIMFIAFLIKYYREDRIDIPGLAKVVIYPALSFLLVHFLFWAVFNFNILNIFLLVLRDAADFNVHSERGYTVWVFQNMIDFFANAGLVQSLLILASCVIILSRIALLIRKAGGKKEVIAYIFEPATLLTLSFFVVLLFLDLIGINRGEVIRLWIFLMVFLQIIVSYFCVTELTAIAFYVVLSAAVFQTVISISMVGFIVP